MASLGVSRASRSVLFARLLEADHALKCAGCQRRVAGLLPGVSSVDQRKGVGLEPKRLFEGLGGLDVALLLEGLLPGVEETARLVLAGLLSLSGGCRRQSDEDRDGDSKTEAHHS